MARITVPKLTAFTQYRVRCLGPGRPEHYFQSLDPVNNRICRRCAGKMLGAAVRVVECPMPAPNGKRLLP